MSTFWGASWVGRESSPGDKRFLKPTIPGSQGQAPSSPTHSMLGKFKDESSILDIKVVT